MMTFESGVIGKLGIVGVVGKVRRKVMGAAFLMGKDGERGAGSGVREGVAADAATFFGVKKTPG